MISATIGPVYLAEDGAPDSSLVATSTYGDAVFAGVAPGVVELTMGPADVVCVPSFGGWPTSRQGSVRVPVVAGFETVVWMRCAGEDPVPAPSTPDDDDPLSSPAARAQRAAQVHLFRHQLLFMLGILLGFVAAFAGGLSLVLSALLFGVAAICWALSGIFAIAGKRHMFGVVGPMGGGNARVRASGHAPVGSAIVGYCSSCCRSGC